MFKNLLVLKLILVNMSDWVFNALLLFNMVETWINTNKLTNSYKLKSKKPDSSSLILNRLSISLWVWLWPVSFRMTFVPCNGLTERYYFWNSTTQPSMQQRSSVVKLTRARGSELKKRRLPKAIKFTGLRRVRFIMLGSHSKSIWVGVSHRGPCGELGSCWGLRVPPTSAPPADLSVAPACSPWTALTGVTPASDPALNPGARRPNLWLLSQRRIFVSRGHVERTGHY